MKSNKLILKLLCGAILITIFVSLLMARFFSKQYLDNESYFINIYTGILVSIIVSLGQYLHYFYEYRSTNKNILIKSYRSVLFTHDKIASLKNTSKSNNPNNTYLLNSIQTTFGTIDNFYKEYNFGEYNNLFLNKKMYKNLELDIQSITARLYNLQMFVIEAKEVDILSKTLINSQFSSYSEYIQIIDKLTAILTSDIEQVILKYVNNGNIEVHQKWKKEITDTLESFNKHNQSFKIKNDENEHSDNLL